MPMILLHNSQENKSNLGLIRALRILQVVAIVLLLGFALTTFVIRFSPRSSSDKSKVTCFTGPSQTGQSFEYTEDQKQWSSHPPDKSFQSVIVKGIWLFYQERLYNFREGGKVTWVYGRDLHYNFPEDFKNKCSSLKFVGNRNSWNEDSITFYSGEYFQGLESSYTDNVDDIFNAGFYKSLIVVGSSPSTLYSDTNFTGSSTCVYTDPKPSIGLDIGFHPVCSNCVKIFSAQKGCHSSKKVFDQEPPLQQNVRGGYGSWSP